MATGAKGEYPVHIGQGLLAQLGALTRAVITGERALIVTDSNVAPLYLEEATASLEDAGFTVKATVIPAGEQSKCLHQLDALYGKLHGAGITRTDVVVALGGGVIGDLAGFAAATYLRGVRLVQVPTTLLAQVDAAIGGKTGIDLPYGKNMAGAFYPPRAVIADTDTLQSLEPRRLREGMSEVIKYGVTLDKELFENIESGTLSPQQTVARCAQLKVDIVRRDELDTGERMLLNFGHTLGHALEKITGFETYTHGEGVAVGMVAALRLGEKLGVTDAGILPRLENVLEQWHLPQSAPISAEQILSAVGADKKQLDGKLNFVLVTQLGQSRTYPITIEQLTPLVREVWDNG